MATSLRSPSSVALPPTVVAPARDRGRLLVAIYTNPDYYPVAISAVRMLAAHFRTMVVCRNTAGPRAVWPCGVTIDRVGPRRTPAESEHASSLAKVAEYVRFVRHVRRAVAQDQPRLIYAYDPLGFAAVLLAAKRGAPPIIFHCHDLPKLERMGALSFQTWPIKYALSRTSRAQFVVFPEKYRAAYWLERARDSRPPMIVPNGARSDFFDAPSDWNALIASRFAGRRVLYMSSMGPENGQQEAIRAAALANSGWRMTLIGNSAPEFRSELEREARALGLEDRVAVAGWVEETERMELLRRAAIGLVLYKPVSRNWEYSGSAPMKLFEYAASGLPVIVPDRPSYREFFADEQWVVYAAADEPASIARAIDSVLADRERYAAMSVAARDAHERKHNYETVFQPVLARIEELAAAPPGVRI
ncbi:MAG TPA: glycosyltransferase family 4 protein [Candidatus Binataceae bacterium]|nr:glycosyltransferase family 4 protein [Candidatus Binataceae bacterium]